MKEEIKEHIEKFVAYSHSLKISLDNIRFILISEFNKKSLMYSFIASKWSKNYYALIKRLGYGKFNDSTQTLDLNPDNDFIQILIVKYDLDKPKEIKVDLTEEEKRVLGI